MTAARASVSEAPLPPVVDLRLRERIDCLRNFHTGADLLRRRYGPVCQVRLGNGRVVPPLVFVSSPQGARDVLAARDGATDKSGRVHQEARAVGLNSFNMAHDEWSPRRRTLQPLFTKQYVESYAAQMTEAVQRTRDRLVSRASVDLDHEMRRLTLNVLGRSLFGTDLGEAAVERLADAVPAVLGYVTARITRPVRLPSAVPTPARSRYRHQLAVIHDVVDEAVAAHRREPGASRAELIRLLHAAADPETGRPLSPAEVRAELVAFLFAGHDTTATSLTYALWQLGRHPGIQDAVAAEVAALGHDEVRPADVHRLPLTNRVLCESMRLCPPGPAIGRRVEKDLVVDGFRVPAGMDVAVSVFALHRDPAAWPDPEAFDPDRFLAEPSAARDRWQFIPFGAGPRKCIGAHFAMLEATVALAMLVSEVRIESLSSDFAFALPFTMTAAGEVPARVSRRRAEA